MFSLRALFGIVPKREKPVITDELLVSTPVQVSLLLNGKTETFSYEGAHPGQQVTPEDAVRYGLKQTKRMEIRKKQDIKFRICPSTSGVSMIEASLQPHAKILFA